MFLNIIHILRCSFAFFLGNLTNLPDAVLGLTLLAAGGCLPESISMTIIARRGKKE